MIPTADLTIIRSLGKSAFCEVQLAKWAPKSNLDVAVKGLNHGPGGTADATCRELLANEGKLLHVLIRYPHPGIVKAYGMCVDTPDGSVRLVMEFCAGGSLDKHLAGIRESGKVVARICGLLYYPLAFHGYRVSIQ